ncbi:hypothetical protein HaLaN_15283, partial [Haematococcus lacustris]
MRSSCRPWTLGPVLSLMGFFMGVLWIDSLASEAYISLT